MLAATLPFTKGWALCHTPANPMSSSSRSFIVHRRRRDTRRERYFSLFRSMGQVFWAQDFLGNIADFDFAGRRGRERRKSIEIAIERAREREGSMTPGPMSTEDPAAPQAEEAQGFASRPRRSCRDRKPALFTYQTAGQTHDVSWVVTSTVYLPCSYAFSLCIV